MIKDAKSKELPFPREVLIDAARLKARGAEWEAIAKTTGADVGELVTFSIDHPEVWGPLYQRAEKLRLAEAEGETLKGLCMLLKGDSDEASECAAKELLIHRRYVERRRQGGSRAKPRDLGLGISEGGMEQSAVRDPQSAMAAAAPKYPEFLTDDPPPEEIVRRITYAAHRVAHGDDYHRIARETGQDEIDVTRWAFIYAKAWDKAYPTARRTAAQAGAALAINRLLDFVVGPDLRQAARAGRMLLVHRRHMHWSTTRAGEGTGTYPSSMTQGLVAIPGWRVATDLLSAKEFAKVIEQGPPRPRPGSQAAGPREAEARESAINRREHKVSPDTGPRSFGAVRPSADSAGSLAAENLNTPLRLSAPSAVKPRLPRPRDGPA